MKETLLMAVDLGTSFIKVAIYDLKSNCIAIADEPVHSDQPKSGVFVQKGEEIFASVIACIQKVSQQLGDRAMSVEAISFTGQMAGFIGVDSKWDDVTTWSCTLDTRFFPYVERMMKSHADLMLEESGTNSPVMAPKIHWFENENPDKAKNVAKYMIISGYVLGKMADIPIEEAVIDATFIQWTGFSDVRNRKWSKKVLDALKINEQQLPNIVNSNTICGHLSKEMAKICGLKSGIPLVSGMGDKPAGCLGAAVVNPGDTIMEAASYGAFSCCVSEYRPDMRSRRLDVIPSIIPGEFYIHNFLPGTGISLDWFVKNFLAQGNTISDELFNELDKKVEAVKPGSDGLLGIGLFGGRAFPFNPAIRGLWMGHTWNHRKEHFYRALQESFGYEQALTLDSLTALYPEYSGVNVNIVGGGANSKVLTQVTADICAREFHRLNRKDVALWGAAIIAGNAIGVFPDIKKTAQDYVKVMSKHTPSEQNLEIYKKYKALYAKIVDAYSDDFMALQSIK